MRKLIAILFPVFFAVVDVSAQEEDLLGMLGEGETTEYVEGAFNTNRVINSHSIENTHGGVLDVKISHRFGRLNEGFYELWGLDNSMVRIGADYGISDLWTMGIGRSSVDKIYDGFLKYKFLRQSTGAKTFPFSAALLYSIGIQATKTNPDPDDVFSSRMAHSTQLLIGRKFSESFSFQIMPTYVHRNLVHFDEENQLYSMGFAGRLKLTKMLAVTSEYFYTPGDQLPEEYTNSLSLGFDLQVGGHVFQLHFTNSTPMAYEGFIPRTDGRWSDGDIHFGFNLSRVFTIKRPDLEE